MFQLTKEQLQLQQQAKELSDSHVKSRAAEVDKSEDYPWDTVERLTQAGFMGMTIPKEYGGRGLSYFDAGTGHRANGAQLRSQRPNSSRSQHGRCRRYHELRQ